MEKLSNRLERENLVPGDHIYTWRACLIYAHHGIYVENNTVIHFTAQAKQKGKGKRISCCSHLPAPPGGGVPLGVRHGVIQSCLDCFLDGGELYLYRYSVRKALFFAQLRGGTCTRANSDEAAIVIGRANYLFDNGFERYHLLKNNCESFALYCKTGLIIRGETNRCKMAKSGQVSAATNAVIAGGIGIVLQVAVHHVIPGAFIVPYSLMRLKKDIGVRKLMSTVSQSKNWPAWQRLAMSNNIRKSKGFIDG